MSEGATRAAAEGAASSSAAPTAAAPAPANPATTLVVNTRQKGNPILKFIRNVTWAYGETPADYMMSESAARAARCWRAEGVQRGLITRQATTRECSLSP